MSIKNRVLCAALLMCSCCMAQKEAENQRSLAGIREVYVLVDDIHLADGTGSTLPGLTRDVLEIDLDTQLRSRGINPQGNGPLFIVRYLVVPEKGFYSLDISVMQWVQLVRDPSIQVLISTWSTADSAGGVKTANLTVQTVRDSLEKQVNQFLGAWSVENLDVKPPQ
jgi:hypothetical protein